MAERLTVAQDVVGSIPTRRPILKLVAYRTYLFPTCKAISNQLDAYPSGFYQRSECGLFKLNCARKEDVVFQMDVLVKILFEFL